MRDELSHYPTYDVIKDFATVEEVETIAHKQSILATKDKVDVSLYRGDITFLNASIDANSRFIDNIDNKVSTVNERIDKTKDVLSKNIGSISTQIQLNDCYNKVARDKIVKDTNNSIKKTETTLLEKWQQSKDELEQRHDLNITAVLKRMASNKKEYIQDKEVKEQNLTTMQQLVIQVKNERDATDKLLQKVVIRVGTLETHYNTIIKILQDLSSRVTILENSQDRLLGSFVFTIPDNEKGIYELNGQQIEDAKLVQFLRDNNYSNFIFDGDRVTLPDLRGRFIGARNGLSIPNGISLVGDDKTAVNGLWFAIQTVINEDNSDTTQIVSNGNWNGGWHNSHNSWHLTMGGDTETLPNWVSMPLCIIGTKGK